LVWTAIARVAADASRTAVFSKVIGADYSVKVSYEQFTAETRVPKGDRGVQIKLDIYTVLLGMPMIFATFLALFIGPVVLVIVVAPVVSEYIRWSGRRLANIQ